MRMKLVTAFELLALLGAPVGFGQEDFAKQPVPALDVEGFGLLEDKSHPEACLSIQNLVVSDEAEPIKRALMDWRAWGLEQFRKRAQRARAEGDLPKQIKPEAFARYLAVIMSGLAHQAATGATLPELKQAIKMFRQTMPFDVEDSTTP